MKKIDTLVSDIRARILDTTPFDKEQVEAFSKTMVAHIVERLCTPSPAPSLRLSNLGTPCDRKLWYSINRPELAEPLSASARLKFLFGDILEHLLLFLARASGHKVEHEQKEVNLAGVEGHIDGTIDGELVDCKSASSFSFNKFQDHGLEREDGFGYLTQLDGYLHSVTSPASGIEGVLNDRAHFLVVDKTLGKICLDTYPRRDVNYERVVTEKRAMLDFPSPPDRGFSDEAETYYRKPTGNRKLGVSCSYCPFKSHCWPGVRVFTDGRKPTFYTKYVKEVGTKREITVEEATED